MNNCEVKINDIFSCESGVNKKECLMLITFSLKIGFDYILKKTALQNNFKVASIKSIRAHGAEISSTKVHKSAGLVLSSLFCNLAPPTWKNIYIYRENDI